MATHIKSQRPNGVHPDIDMDRFRLRTFADELVRHGEIEVVDDWVELAEVPHRLEGNDKAVLFRAAGPDKQQLIGNVVASRSRLALAFGVDERDLRVEASRRLAKPIAPVVVSRGDAPVQDIVLQGDDADLTKLPVHLQHGFDGGPYISASIDFTASSSGDIRNIGYRRLMLRGRQRAGVDMQAPSDLRAQYMRYAERGERMPIAFVIGSHPLDSLAAVAMKPVDDEVSLMGALRESPVPIVKCVTNDLMVPADAEVVLEGYLDERGYFEPEGPYGEFLGYYGPIKINPIFKLTAITRRKDALFQTATIGGRSLGRTDTSLLCALRTEMTAWSALETAIREPVAVYCPASTGGMFNLRVSLRQRYPGEARNAIAAIHGSMADVKNVFVVDDDINIFTDDQIEWAMATRFQADRDIVVASNFRTMPLDPSLDGKRQGSKTGFDLTFPFGWQHNEEFRVPEPPKYVDRPKVDLIEALKASPKYFSELMDATGSRDGREIVRELERIWDSQSIKRDESGRYFIETTEG